MLSKDDSFIDLLDAPKGAAFEWDRRTQAFVPEDDAGADGGRSQPAAADDQSAAARACAFFASASRPTAR